MTKQILEEFFDVKTFNPQAKRLNLLRTKSTEEAHNY